MADTVNQSSTKISKYDEANPFKEYVQDTPTETTASPVQGTKVNKYDEANPFKEFVEKPTELPEDAEELIRTRKPYSEPDAKQKFYNDLNAVIKSGKWTNATPKEMQNQIIAEYGDKYIPLVRDVTELEKAERLSPEFAQGLFYEDKVWGFYDPKSDSSISLNNPNMTRADWSDNAPRILEGAALAAVSRGKTIPRSMALAAGSSAGLDYAQQKGNIALGGKDDVDWLQVGLAGGFGAMPDMFTGIIAGGLTVFQEISNLTKGSRIRNAETLDMDTSKLPQPVKPETITNSEYKALLEKAVNDPMVEMKDGKLAVKKTPAEQGYTGGTVRQQADPKTKELMQTEQEILLDNVKVDDKPLFESWLNERNLQVRDAMLDDNGILSPQKLIKSLEPSLKGLNEELGIAQQELKRTDLSDIDRKFYESYQEKLKNAIEETKSVQNKLQNVKGTLVDKNEMDELVLDAIRATRNVSKRTTDLRYDLSREIGEENYITGHIINKLLPKEILDNMENRPEINTVIERFTELLEPKVLRKTKKDSDGNNILDADGNFVYETESRTLDDLDEARKYLKGVVDQYLDKTNPRFDYSIGSQLKKLSDNLDEVEAGYTKTLPENSPVKSFLESREKARKSFANEMKKFGPDELLGKIVKDIDSGNISADRIMLKLLGAKGNLKVGGGIVDKLDETGLSPIVTEAIKHRLFTIPGEHKSPQAGLRLGDDLRKQWNIIKNDPNIEKLLGDEYSKIDQAVEELSKIDVPRLELIGISRKDSTFYEALSKQAKLMLSNFRFGIAVGIGNVLLELSKGKKLKNNQIKELRDILVNAERASTEPIKLVSDGYPLGRATAITASTNVSDGVADVIGNDDDDDDNNE